MSIKKELQRRHEQQQMEIQRVRLPKGREVFGVLEQRLGASRSKVKCLDGKERICRIPGRLKRKLWVREGDIILVEPWEYDDSKGDVVHKYRYSQIAWLKKRGYIKGLEESEEF